MGKRIRHLEFYGYADQNVYMGLPNVDLSDIRETNKEQDKEISALSSATKDKADVSLVNELSGKVDTFVDEQGRINRWFAKGINKNRERIENLEHRDEEITNKINEIVDDFNPIYDELNALSGRIDTIDEKLEQHLQEESEFEDNTNERLDFLEDEIVKKLDSSEAESIYAKKEDVYTKEEVDELFESYSGDYATKEWVIDQGYITENDADAKYSTKQELEGLRDIVDDVQASVDNVSSELAQFEELTNNNVEDLNNKIDSLEAQYTRDITELQEDVEDLTNDVRRNSNDIYQINNVALPNKADKSDLVALSSRVDTINANLNNKVDKIDYIRDQNLVEAELNNLKETKASKEELRNVSGAIDSLDAKIDREIQDRINGDESLDRKIASANTRIDIIREENIERDANINDLRTDLDIEIAERKQADIDLIGSPSDVDEDNTIYGAKKYADKVSNQALNSSKIYTDDKNRETRDYVDETKANLERQITAKADKSYVDAVKDEIQISVDEKVLAEKNRAQEVEAALNSAIRQETQRAINKEVTISSALTHTSNIVKALTDWDGDDRADYTDEGNGIVDVMHREIHDIEEAISAITIIGEGIETSNPHEVGFGTYNVTHTGLNDSDKTMFTIGVGNSSFERKNAIEIRRNGDIYMWIEGEYMKINDLLAMLAHETY